MPLGLGFGICSCERNSLKTQADLKLIQNTVQPKKPLLCGKFPDIKINKDSNRKKIGHLKWKPDKLFCTFKLKQSLHHSAGPPYEKESAEVWQPHHSYQECTGMNTVHGHIAKYGAHMMNQAQNRMTVHINFSELFCVILCC